MSQLGNSDPQNIILTYKLDGAVGGSLVALLAVEEQALAGLGGP